MKSPNLRHDQARSQNKELNRAKPAADHPPPVTGSQSWKGAITAPERHYLPNCKQASLLRLLGVLDSHHPPEKVHQLYTQKSSPLSQKEVGKNIKDKKRDKRGRDGAPSQEGSLKKREVVDVGQNQYSIVK